MKADIYTLDEVKIKLATAGEPADPTNMSPKDIERKAIVTAYVEWAESNYYHENYEKENYKIVAQVNRFTAALQAEEWASNELKDKEDTRDNLIEKNKLLRDQCSLTSLVPKSAEYKADQYCLDPFVQIQIKSAMDHDEARACGGTCHSTDPNMAYHIVDLPTVLSSGGYIVADISEQKYQELKAEMLDYCNEEQLVPIQLKAKEEADDWASTQTEVSDFVTNWDTPGGTREKILVRKETVLNQRLTDRQIRNLRSSNEELQDMINRRAGDDLGGALVPDDIRLGPVDRLGPDRKIDRAEEDLPEDD